MRNSHPSKSLVTTIFFVALGLCLGRANFAMAGSDEIVQQYRELHRALSKDEVVNAKAAAQSLASATQQWISSGENEPRLEEAKAILQSAQLIPTLSEDQGIRVEFGNLNKAFVSFLRKSPDLKARLQLFFCPMFPQAYAYWVQLRGEALANPYWGQKMYSCGVKKAW